MAGSQLTLTVSLVMISLFAVAILGYSYGFATDNDAALNLANDDSLSSLNVSTRSNLSTYKGESEETYRSIVNSSTGEGSDVVKTAGSFSITWGNVFGITKNIFDVGYKKIFGSGDNFGIFLSSFFGIIGLMIALYLIKTWRGNP